MRRAALLALALTLMVGCGDDRPSGTDGGGGGFDAGGGADGGGVDVDGGGGGLDAGGGGFDAGPPAADVGLTFSGGCAPDFGGDVVVVRNTDSIAVSSTRGGALVGSIQLALRGQPRHCPYLSTQHRIDSGSVINVVVDTTWTNIAMDSAGVLGGTVTDPIGGQLTIRTYDEAAGMVDVDFTAVTLQNPSTGSVCQIDGRLQTFRLSF
ncbi:MAG: hypothetical protein R3B82_29030 [Sandaracinaceae bacterium]